MIKRFVAFWRATTGSIAVELALSVPILAVLTTAAFDIAQGFQTNLRLESAARAGAQYAVYLGATEDPAGVIQAARDDADDPGLGVSTPTYICTCASTGSAIPCNSNCSGDVPMMTVTVTVNGQYTPMFDYPGLPDAMPLQQTIQMRVR